MTITKADIMKNVDFMLQIYGHEKKKGYEVVETLIEIIKQDLEQGNDLMISNFGKFCVKDKRARKGRNPATGEKMTITARRVVLFKAARKLRDRVDGKEKEDPFLKALRED